MLIGLLFQAEREKEKGITGYTDTQDELEKISAQKGVADEQKGKILEDMSDMVNFCVKFCDFAAYFVITSPLGTQLSATPEKAIHLKVSEKVYRFLL